jgi:hypothetical protein
MMERSCLPLSDAPSLPTARFEGTIHGANTRSGDAFQCCWRAPRLPRLFGYARRFVFANVACYPAAKTLPNGENAHCTIRPVEFWREIFDTSAAATGNPLWEVWADTPFNGTRREQRIGNFEPQREAPSSPQPPNRIPLWRMV